MRYSGPGNVFFGPAHLYSGLKDESWPAIAWRDIQPNDEIAVDYHLFLYDMTRNRILN